jgi:hypothetical protein
MKLLWFAEIYLVSGDEVAPPGQSSPMRKVEGEVRAIGSSLDGAKSMRTLLMVYA